MRIDEAIEKLQIHMMHYGRSDEYAGIVVLAGDARGGILTVLEDPNQNALILGPLGPSMGIDSFTSYNGLGLGFLPQGQADD